MPADVSVIGQAQQLISGELSNSEPRTACRQSRVHESEWRFKFSLRTYVRLGKCAGGQLISTFFLFYSIDILKIMLLSSNIGFV